MTTRRRRRGRKPSVKPREVLFLLSGGAILYHEVWIANTSDPLLVFTALFLWGLVPAFRADGGALPSVKEVMRAWLLAETKDDDEGENETRVDPRP
jgi:hypothetical protein